jgi:hypothetical protein
VRATSITAHRAHPAAINTTSPAEHHRDTDADRMARVQPAMRFEILWSAIRA